MLKRYAVLLHPSSTAYGASGRSGAAARRLCQKIGKQLARRLQSIITLLSVGYNSVPLKRQYHVE
jgi:hypothetical protein